MDTTFPESYTSKTSQNGYKRAGLLMNLEMWCFGVIGCAGVRLLLSWYVSEFVWVGARVGGDE